MDSMDVRIVVGCFSQGLYVCVQADGLDAAADLEVDRIVSEITAGVLSPAASAPVRAVASNVPVVAATPASEEAAPDASTQDLLSRLQAL